MTKERLKTALESNKMALSDYKISKLADYLHLLNRWNATYNLTSITDIDKQITKHLLDSLIISPHLRGNSILDVGTGAGLPGIPLAINCPDKTFTLLDCNQKKTRFLVQAKAMLGLDNVNVAHQRIEKFNHPPFDCILSRAFSSLADFLYPTQHLLAKDGIWLAMKGTFPEQEISEIAQDFRVTDVRQLSILGLDAQRHLAIIQQKG